MTAPVSNLPGQPSPTNVAPVKTVEPVKSAEPDKPKGPYDNLGPEEKDRLLSTFAATIRANREDMAVLASKVQSLETNQAARDRVANEPTSEQLNKQFLDRPADITRDLIKKEVSEAIAPLVEYVRGASAVTEYDRIKADLSQNPRFKGVLDRAGPYVDELVRKSGTKPSREGVTAAILSVAGAVNLGMIPELRDSGSPPHGNQGNQGNQDGQNNNQGNQGTPQMNWSNLPPHLRPSPAPGPSGNVETKQKREYTENERRVMRENHMTEEEFEAGLTMSASDVVKKDKWPSANKEGKK